MRTLTAGLFISVDGVVEAPDRWHFPYFDAEMGAAVDAQLGSAETLLLGRVTYDGFAGAWPRREAEGGEDAAFATRLGDVRKIVASRRQDLQLGWRNTELVSGDLIGSVTALKSETGGTIAVSGSVSIVRQLLGAGLIDELHLLLHPIAVGTGMRLLDDGAPIPLHLIASTAFTTGVVHLVYGPAGKRLP